VRNGAHVCWQQQQQRQKLLGPVRSPHALGGAVRGNAVQYRADLCWQQPAQQGSTAQHCCSSQHSREALRSTAGSSQHIAAQLAAGGLAAFWKSDSILQQFWLPECLLAAVALCVARPCCLVLAACRDGLLSQVYTGSY
jgi:hypothetical protein